MTEDLTAPWDKKSVPAVATAVVKRIEGFSATPYDDNGSKPGGTWTIGYGTIRDAQNKPVTSATPPINEAEAETLLERDMLGAAEDVARNVKRALLICEAGALISWTYNLGGQNLASSGMLKCVNAGENDKVPGEMHKWINQDKKPVLGLLRRRWAEAAIYIGLNPNVACTRAWSEIRALTDWPSMISAAPDV